jgi:hypothetical protein
MLVFDPHVWELNAVANDWQTMLGRPRANLVW